MDLNNEYEKIVNAVHISSLVEHNCTNIKFKTRDIMPYILCDRILDYNYYVFKYLCFFFETKLSNNETSWSMQLRCVNPYHPKC